MLIPSDIEYIELIRRLEAAGHVFPVDKDAVEEGLRHETMPVQEKYLRRVGRLDGDGTIAQMLARVHLGLRWLPRLAGIAAFIAGFVAVTAWANTAQLNIFYVLLFFLGTNTLMFAVWLFGLFLPKARLHHSWADAALSWFARTPLRSAWTAMWRDNVGVRGVKLWAGTLSHRLWLMTLIGMAAGFVWLLLVREYTFHWQSTLLTQNNLEKLIAALAYLPSWLGFPVPDAQVLAGSRHLGHLEWSRSWAGFLIGCVLVYGIIPRALAWLVCAAVLRRSLRFSLDENLPYYRRLQRLWTQRIVDHDEETRPVPTASAIAVRVGSEEKISCTLEVPAENPYWADNVLGHHWPYWATLDNTQDVAALLHVLQQNPMQLLVGIRASALPERGLLRQLRDAAQGGVLVMLLPEKKRTAVKARALQWQQALQQENIALVNPHPAGEPYDASA